MSNAKSPLSGSSAAVVYFSSTGTFDGCRTVVMYLSSTKYVEFASREHVWPVVHVLTAFASSMGWVSWPQMDEPGSSLPLLVCESRILTRRCNCAVFPGAGSPMSSSAMLTEEIW